MAKYRKKIPTNVEAEVLFINERTCCICRDSNKRVQIHHIDGNPNNNNLSNLAVVCANHQDEIHKTGGITKGISPALVKRYKRNWELTVRRRRTQQHSPLKSSLGIEKILFEFEIRKAAYELAALKDNDTDGVNQRLDFLYTIYLLEGYTGQILRALDQIVVLTALRDENKTCLITDKIHEFFYHLLAPKKVKKKDIDNLDLAIRMIGTVGSFSAEFRKSFKVIKSVSMAFENIWDALIWCDLESLALTVLNQLNKISKACKIVYEDERPLTAGLSELSKLRKKLKKVSAEEKTEWKKVLTRLELNLHS